LLLGDVEQGFSSKLLRELKDISTGSVIKVLNKIDLKKDSEIDVDVEISALTGEGIDGLLERIKEAAFGTSGYSEKTAIISNLRHYNCLKDSKKYLRSAKESLLQSMSGEFISVDLRSAEQSLAEIIGVVTSEDILNNIFSKFCIGK
jgi:tRNA modification GTPase